MWTFLLRIARLYNILNWILYFFCGFCVVLNWKIKQKYSKESPRSCRLYLTYSNQLVWSSFTSYCGIPALPDFLQTVWCILLTEIIRFVSVLWDGQLSLQGKAATERCRGTATVVWPSLQDTAELTSNIKDIFSRREDDLHSSVGSVLLSCVLSYWKLVLCGFKNQQEFSNFTIC